MIAACKVHTKTQWEEVNLAQLPTGTVDIARYKGYGRLSECAAARGSRVEHTMLSLILTLCCAIAHLAPGTACCNLG